MLTNAKLWKLFLLDVVGDTGRAKVEGHKC